MAAPFRPAAARHPTASGQQAAGVPATRRHWSAVLSLAVLLLLSATPSQAVTWVTYSSPPDTQSVNQAVFISMAIDTVGAVCVAFSDKSTNLTVRRHDTFGGGWGNIGGSLHSGGSQYVSLAQGPGGENHVVYRGNSGTISVLAYNPAVNKFNPVGPLHFSAGSVTYTSLAIDSNLVRYVVYGDETVSRKATVQKFVDGGSKWSLVGPKGLSAGPTTDTRIAVGSDRVPVIAYADGSLGGRLSVLKFSANAWRPIKALGVTANKVNSIRLRLDSKNRPVVGFAELLPAPTLGKATAVRWNGTAWIKLPTAGSIAAAAGPRQTVSLALDSLDRPYIAYSDNLLAGKATVKKYVSGVTWSPVGPGGFSKGVARYLDIALDEFDFPIAAFSDAGRGNKTTVMVTE